VYDEVSYNKDQILSALPTTSLTMSVVSQKSDIDDITLQTYNVIDITSLSLIEDAIASVESLNPAGARLWISLNDVPTQVTLNYYLTSYQLAGLLVGLIALLICLMAMCLTINLQSPVMFTKQKLEYGRAQE
jgi:hypothetical protein